MFSSVERIDSTDTNVSKYVFDYEDAIAEAVLYRYGSYEKRTVICCSTQSGCPVGCRFCGAGNYFVRSLKAHEIVAQVQYLMADRGIDHTKVERFQIMFMSMGEPMLNYRELAGAMVTLNALYPGAKLLISTSGPKVDYLPLQGLSCEIENIGLQFSVHESTNDSRDKLIPFKNKLTLEEIAAVGERWAWATGRAPFFNYCAHPDNSSPEDADRLLALFDPRIWQCTISVICEKDEGVAAANARQRNLATGFEQLMKDRGYSTRTFDPAGQDDIGGGCGQLWFVQEWMKRNPDRARPSIGCGMPDVHTPKEE